MKRLKTVADATAQPKLHAGTYWGGFKLAFNADSITAEIISNRDEFAERWRLKRLIGGVDHRPATRAGEEFDHAESWTDAEGRAVLVVSNYNMPPPVSLGMERIAPIYCTEAESYAARYENHKELRARLDACRVSLDDCVIYSDTQSGVVGKAMRLDGCGDAPCTSLRLADGRTVSYAGRLHLLQRAKKPERQTYRIEARLAAQNGPRAHAEKRGEQGYRTGPKCPTEHDSKHTHKGGIMITERPTAASVTDYPELFSQTYWGCNPADSVAPEIIENRNRLAAEWKLKSKARFPTPFFGVPRIDCACDHVEIYTAEGGGYVLVCSNYGCPSPPELGMQEIAPVYMPDVLSYAVRFPSRKAMLAAVNEARRCDNWIGRRAYQDRHKTPPDIT